MIKTKKKIPEFKNVREAAKFWDKHDIGEFMDELKIVEGVYSPVDQTKTTMTIRLAPSLKKKVEKVAKSYDISTSSLIRMWVVDRLQQFAS